MKRELPMLEAAFTAIPSGEATEVVDETLAAWVIEQTAPHPHQPDRLGQLRRECALAINFVCNCFRLRSVSRAKWVFDYERASK